MNDINKILVMVSFCYSFHQLQVRWFFNQRVLIFFLFLHENICYGYSLEVPHWGTSNEYPQHMLSWRNMKNIYLDIPRLDLWTFFLMNRNMWDKCCMICMQKFWYNLPFSCQKMKCSYSLFDIKHSELHIKVPYILSVSGPTLHSKQCWQRWDGTESGIWSGSILFDTHQILDTSKGSKMDLFRQ